MKIILRLSILSILSLLILTSCKTLPKGTSPHMATWLSGEHTVPAAITLSGRSEKFIPNLDKTKFKNNISSKLKQDAKVPAIVYLHGCQGFNSEDYSYKDIFIDKGYAVFMPDSYARPEKENDCGKGEIYLRIPSRQREASTALKEIRKLTWIDQSKVLLVGFNEGGHTTTSWYNDDFTALISIGSHCVDSGGTLNAPAHVPVLTLIGEDDDFHPGWSCKVTRVIGGSKSVVIKNAPHLISHYSKTKEAITTFLNTCCQKIK